jgi:hypothetical protein
VIDRRINWIARNGALALALYFANVEHVGWLAYAISAFAWWSFATAAWTAADPSAARPATGLDAPLASAMAFDVAALGAMFVAHWYWTAFAYAMSCGFSAMIQARAVGKS